MDLHHLPHSYQMIFKGLDLNEYIDGKLYLLGMAPARLSLFHYEMILKG